MKAFKLLLLAILLLGTVNASAQEKRIRIGVKGGLNISSLTGNYFESKIKAGYNLGLVVDYAFNSKWYLSSGLEYTAKGVNYEEDVWGFKPSIRANYVQLPVCFGYRHVVNSDLNFYAHTGPYFAYGVGGKYEVAFEGEKMKINTFDEVLKKFDAGLTFAIGFEIKKINFIVSWDLGILDAVKDKDFIPTDYDHDYDYGWWYDKHMRTTNFSISAGYKF